MPLVHCAAPFFEPQAVQGKATRNLMAAHQQLGGHESPPCVQELSALGNLLYKVRNAGIGHVTRCRFHASQTMLLRKLGALAWHLSARVAGEWIPQSQIRIGHPRCLPIHQQSLVVVLAEDDFLVARLALHTLSDEGYIALYGIFDGHGPNGFRTPQRARGCVFSTTCQRLRRHMCAAFARGSLPESIFGELAALGLRKEHHCHRYLFFREGFISPLK
eukprot:6473617-Amphidinium_carterae.2